MNKDEKIYYENFNDAVERNRKKLPEVHKKLKNAGVKYVLSSLIKHTLHQHFLISYELQVIFFYYAQQHR